VKFSLDFLILWMEMVVNVCMTQALSVFVRDITVFYCKSFKI